MRNLNELNINERGKPVTTPAPTLEDVVEFEKAYGLQIPAIYLDLLQNSNGGHPELDVYSSNTTESHTPQWSINHFYNLGSSKDSTCSIWTAINNWRKFLDEGELPFAEDPGGNLYFMSTRNESFPVSVCIHDESFRKIQIAPSFESFIDGLSIDPDMI